MKTGQYIEDMKIRDFIFLEEPTYYNPKSYLEAIEKIRALAKKEKGILSVYLFGGKKFIGGISDLDLIFVLKDNARLPRMLKGDFRDKDMRYLAYHPVFILNEHIMENINYIYPYSEFRLIHGKEIKIKKLSKKDYAKSLSYLKVDFVLRHVPSDFLERLLLRKIGARGSLLRLNTLTYSIKILKQLCKKEKKEWDSYASKIKNLRQNWFSLEKNSKRETILELTKEAVYISMDIANELENFLKKNIEVKTAKDVIFKGTNQGIIFVDDFDCKKSIEKMIYLFKKNKYFYSILPKTFLHQLCSYTETDGPLSSYIKKRLKYKCKVKNKCHVLKKRIEVLNEQVKLAIKLKHTHFPCFFPLGYKNTSGLINKLRYAALITIRGPILRKLKLFLINIKQEHSSLK